MFSGKSCCYGCVPPRRQPGCHDRCPDRAKEQRALEPARRRLREENEARGYRVTEIMDHKRRLGR